MKVGKKKHEGQLVWLSNTSPPASPSVPHLAASSAPPRMYSTTSPPQAVCANASLLLDEIFPISNLLLQTYTKMWVIPCGLVVKVGNCDQQQLILTTYTRVNLDFLSTWHCKSHILGQCCFLWLLEEIPPTPGKMHVYPKTNTAWQLTAQPTNMPNHTNPLLKKRGWHKYMLNFIYYI